MKYGLAFSGGKDSLACLLLHRHKLSGIAVFWVNTGKTYPETLKIVEFAKKISPNFVEVISDQQGQNDYWGLPSDIVPIEWTRHGQDLTTKKPVMIQSYMQCCFENIAVRMNEAAKAHGVTHIISGQRKEENRKATTKNNQEFDGLIYTYPIEDWTSFEVLSYIAKHMDLPAHFNLKHTSLDCFDCTAYQKDTKNVSLWRANNHPELHKQYLARKEKLDSAIREALEI